ncbi:structural maintenance of chromosomes protein 6-like isoform X1 [Varroa jacobsoni]|nr:structural maintenance of chromosomes protein 6-like isoform X1 [Varroa jacobsoni]
MASNIDSPTASRPYGRKRHRRTGVDEKTQDSENLTEHFRRSKVPRADASLYQPNQPYLPGDHLFGVIERISLKNFMCHSHLEFAFAPRVNFIVGRNGSGKSAVLTAVMVGLGGKTTATNRGAKTASFIQNGKPSARVEITLANRGSYAYKPDEFGPSITVSRIIRRTGAQYEIRSHDRRLVSTKHEDLQTILRHLNIQVDNPIVVLNQETSRNFLQSKNAKDKYQFFMKATQLEEIKENYRQTAEDYKQATRNLESKSELLNELESQKAEYELRLKIVANIANERLKVEKLEGELLWSAVVKHEALVKEATTQVEKYEAHLVQLQKQMDTVVNDIEFAEKEVAEKTTRIEVSLAEKSELTKQTEASRRTVNQLKENFRSIETEQKKLKREIRDLQGDRVAIQNHMSNQQELGKEWHQEKARREQEIEIILDKIKKLRESEPEAQATEQAARKELARTEDMAREHRTTLSDLETQVQRLRHRISIARATLKDAVNRFGPSTAQVLRDIVDEKRFRVPPKGPIGNFVAVKDDNWVYAVERHCSSTLTGWMVDNNEDSKLLKQILLRHRVTPMTLYTRRMGRPRYNCSMPDSRNSSSRCMVSVVDIKDNDVFNLLIDINRIHNVLLYDQLNVALADMKNQVTVPKNCTLAVDVEYNRVFPTPKYRYFANDRPLQVKYLSRTADDILPQLERELEPLIRQEAIAKQDLQIAQRAQANAEKTVREAKSVFRDITRSLAKYEEEVRQLRDFEEPVSVTNAPLENEIKRIDKEIAAKEAQFFPIQERIKEAIDAIRPANNTLKEKELMIQEINDRTQRLRKEVERLQQRIKEHRVELRNFSSRKGGLEDTLEQLREEQAVKQRELDEAAQKAVEKCSERIDTRRREGELRIELKTLKQQIAHMESEQPDPVETKENYDRCVEKYNCLSEELNLINTYMLELSRLTQKRLNLYKTVRDLYCFLINTLFNSLMMYEKFYAELLFNHEAQTLEIHVPVLAGNNSNASRDVRGLSGGERSYSTVCFICSLWVNTASTPFRMLDEFDIFMDMSKRRKSLQMLLQVCQLQPGCQFIFLTPLEMPQLDALKENIVRIQMMPEPRRNNLSMASTSSMD